jgi:hypothetical protein
MRKVVVLALALGLAGCASHGAVADPAQKELAMTACQGEMQKAHLSMTHSSGIGMIDRADRQQIYAGCVAEKGYVAMSLR